VQVGNFSCNLVSLFFFLPHTEKGRNGEGKGMRGAAVSRQKMAEVGGGGRFRGLPTVARDWQK
jgi:hypothetical protein